MLARVRKVPTSKTAQGQKYHVMRVVQLGKALYSHLLHSTQVNWLGTSLGWGSYLQTDMAALTTSACKKLDVASLVKTYNDGLQQVLDKHALLVTRCIRDHPSAPWLSAEVRDARRKRRCAEQLWRTTKLSIHKDMYINMRKEVTKCVTAAKRLYFTSKIDSAVFSKQLFKVSMIFLENLVLPFYQLMSRLMNCHNNFANSLLTKLRNWGRNLILTSVNHHLLLFMTVLLLFIFLSFLKMKYPNWSRTCPQKAVSWTYFQLT